MHANPEKQLPSSPTTAMPTTTKPEECCKLPLRVFVGSSSQVKDHWCLEDALIIPLRGYIADVEPWWDCFGAGETTIETLLRKTRECDLALFLVAPEDFTCQSSGNKPRFEVRDNVTFELGLFAGALGARRSLMLRVPLDREGNTANEHQAPYPSDLQGVTSFDLERSENGAWDWKKVVDRIKKLADERMEQDRAGWWAIATEHQEHPTERNTRRSFYGVFQAKTRADGMHVSCGVLHYGVAFKETKLYGVERERWEKVNATLVEHEPGSAGLVLYTDVIGLPHPGDPKEDVHKIRSYRLFMRLTGCQGCLAGTFINFENNLSQGNVRMNWLGACTREEAVAIAREWEANLPDSPCKRPRSRAEANG
ncbi:MAG: nucleotide-binding protein [Verrucomicrobia bacterium]|nr:nucleotide-binding protein [Verrucomicrobiota bacterium]